MSVKDYIRTIPDFPSPGIMFRDVTTLFGDPRGFRMAVDQLLLPWAGVRIDKVAGLEARGFILGGAVAQRIGAGFIPVRKPGKLPHKVSEVEYTLEYGVDALQMHADAISGGARVFVHDDLLATGGTMAAATQLLRRIGADVRGAACIIELEFLKGRQRFDIPLFSLIQYES